MQPEPEHDDINDITIKNLFEGYIEARKENGDVLSEDKIAEIRTDFYSAASCLVMLHRKLMLSAPAMVVLSVNSGLCDELEEEGYMICDCGSHEPDIDDFEFNEGVVH